MKLLAVQGILVLFLVSNSLQAQSASYSITNWKLSCTGHPRWGKSWQPKLVAKTLPKLGGRLQLETDFPTAPYGIVLLFTGVSDKKFGTLKLPLNPSTFLRGVWCGQLMTSVDIMTPAGGTVWFPIPNDRGLIGLRFFQQTFQTYNVSPGQFSLSALGVGVIGT